MRLPMQFIRLLATFTAVLLGGHLLSSCGGKTSPKSSGGNEAPGGPTSEIVPTAVTGTAGNNQVSLNWTV